ncbi:MAG TPA: hypothetical protein VIV15_15120 [Anaerolineales bacterium]
MRSLPAGFREAAQWPWYTWAMSTQMLSAASRLSDRELLEHVPVLAQREREATAALVAHLAVLDERRLYLGEGCSSLFTYCTQVLHLSENAAYRRVEAARVVRAYPMVLDLLAEGAISLTTIRLLAPELTPANHRRLLDAAKHQPTRQVERLVAGLRPHAPVPATIRQLPTRAASFVFTAPPNAAADRLETATAGAGATLEPPTLEIRRPAKPAVVPLTATRFKIQFTASEETHDLLRRAQDLLRHQIPDGNIGEVMAKALQVLVRELEKEKLAAADRPRTGDGTDSGSRHIPAAVKRAVWKRDGGQCAFVASNGRRCAERGFLEFHHVEPYGAGGDATVENIELRCRAHNGYEAELFFSTRGSSMAREVESAYASASVSSAQTRHILPVRSIEDLTGSHRDGSQLIRLARATTCPPARHVQENHRDSSASGVRRRGHHADCRDASLLGSDPSHPLLASTAPSSSDLPRRARQVGLLLVRPATVQRRRK